MYEIERYVSVNTRRRGGAARGARRAARAAPEASSWRRRCRSTARAPTATPDGRWCTRRCARRPQLAARRCELRGRGGQPLAPVADARGEAAPADLGLRHHQARPRGALPRGGRGLRHPDGRAALLQRLRAAPGALESLHRRDGDLLGAAAERPRRRCVFEDGRQSRDFVHVSDIVQANLLALERTPPTGGVYNVGTGRATSRAAGGRDARASCSASASAPEVLGKFRAGDIRHCLADVSPHPRASSATSRGSPSSDGLRELLAWLRTQSAEDRVDAARAASSPRAG